MLFAGLSATLIQHNQFWKVVFQDCSKLGPCVLKTLSHVFRSSLSLLLSSRAYELVRKKKKTQKKKKKRSQVSTSSANLERQTTRLLALCGDRSLTRKKNHRPATILFIFSLQNTIHFTKCSLLKVKYCRSVDKF